MKKWIAAMLCVMLLCGSALASQDVVLPGERYTLTLPEGMKYSPKTKVDDEQSPYFQYAYFSGTVEMDVFLYESGGVSLWDLAESMGQQGHEVTIQNVNGTELLCYSGVVDDTADGAECIGYVIMDGDQVIEIAFWYASQKGLDQTAEIIGTLK